MDSCRIGFVGAGGVAARHARMLAAFDDVDLVAVTDVDPARARAVAAHHGMAEVATVEELLGRELDAVYVCVPPFAHGEIEEAVLEAGLALFVEKPLGVSLSVPQRIAKIIATTGAVTAVGHHWRYSAAVRQAQDLLVGREIRLVTGSWLDKVPPVPWWTNRAQSGGQIVEQAVHVLDLARLLVGDVAEVNAVADARSHASSGDVDGAFAATMRFAGGAIGTVAATCLLGAKHRAALDIYAPGLALSISETGLEWRSGEHDVRRSPIDPDAAKAAADRAFVNAVLTGSPVRADYGEALRTHRLACALALSATDGRTVELTHES